jgi:hypothetical protein
MTRYRIANCQLQISHYKLNIIGRPTGTKRPGAARCPPPTFHCQLPTAHYPLSTAHYPLPPVCLLLTAYCLLGFFVRAPAAEDAGPPLHFRRIGVPADRLAEAAGGKEKYLPLKTQEFQHLLEQLHSPSGRGEGTAGAEIRSAEYRAQFAVEGVLVGRAELDIRQFQPSPVFLPLAPCRLAIGRSWWNSADADDAQNDSIPAILGVDSQGRAGTLVERSGRLFWEWSLQGRQRDSNRWEFLFAAPACPVNNLILELPPALRPEVSMVPGEGKNLHAEDRRGPPEVQAVEILPCAQDDRGGFPRGDKVEAGPCLWRVRWAGSPLLHLQLKEPPAADALPAATLRESRVYECSSRGLNVSAQWRIQSATEPLTEIRVLLDPGLQLIAARYGDQEVPWTVSPLPDAQGERATLSLPESFHGAGRILQLAAIAPLELDQPWSLPRLRPENLLWENGETTLIVPPPLLLQGLRPQACRQTAAEFPEEPLRGETSQFQCFRDDATVEIRLTRRPALLPAGTATSVEIGSGEISARMAVELRPADALQFTHAVQLAPHWWIDAVETIPPQQPVDWSLEPQSDGSQKLQLYFPQTLASAPKCRLIFRARRLRTPAKNTLCLEDLLPFRFLVPMEGRRLVSVQTTGPYTIKLPGGGMKKCLSPQDLSPREWELFAAPPGPLLIEEGTSPVGEFSIEKQRLRYAGSVRVEALIREKRLDETIVVHCQPESGPVDRILVQLTPADQTPPRWTVAGEEETLFSARRWPREEEIAAGRSGAGETWELSLRHPHPVPFEIRGVRERAFAGPTPMVLAALPEASHQEGSVVVRSPAAFPVTIDNRRLKSILPEPSPASLVSLVRGTFRYDPARDVSAAEPPLWAAPAPPPTGPAAFIWEGRLESWYSTSGRTQHVARYHVQNSSAEALRFTLPKGVTWEDLLGAWINDQPVAWQKVPVPSAAGEKNPSPAFSVSLPAESRPLTVILQYRSLPTPLKNVGRLTPPWCRPNSPVLEKSWTVWLPPGYEVVGKNPAELHESSPEILPAERLFGPLGRLPGDGNGLSRAALRNQPPSSSPEGPSAGPFPGDSSADTHLWTAARVLLPDDVSASVSYAYRWTWRLLGMMVFLAAVGLIRWGSKKGTVPLGSRGLSPFSGLGLAACGGLLGLTALWIAEPYAPLATGGFLAILFCTVLRAFRQSSQRNENDFHVHQEGRHSCLPLSGQTRMSGLLFWIVWLLSGALLWGGHHLAAEEVFSAVPAAGDPFRVLIPIDAEKQPVGESVYLPEPLYRELYRRLAAVAPQPQGWFFSAGRYQGVWTRESVSGRVVLKSLQAEYALQTFAGPARVRLPYRREQADLPPDGITLDGLPQPFTWEADGSGVALEVPEAGKYRLQCTLQPAVRSAEGWCTLEVSVPPIPTAQWEMSFPAGVTGVEVPGALGRVREENNPLRLTAACGPRGMLVARWPESGHRETAAEIEEFLWLKVQPGAVVTDVRWKIRPGARAFQRLQLWTESTLRLQPPVDPSAPDVKTAALPDGRQAVTLVWPRPLTEETTVDLSFLPSGSSGVGALWAPEIRLKEVRPVRRWLAVSLDPRLEYESPQTGKGSGIRDRSNRYEAAGTDGQGTPRGTVAEHDHLVGPSRQIEPVPVSEYLKAWGSTAATPSLAYRSTAENSTWAIFLRPRPAEVRCEPALTLLVDRDAAEVFYDAQITTEVGYVFQYRISAPPELQVESLSLEKDGRQWIRRWARLPDGSLTLFLQGPVDGKQQLQLRGKLPFAVPPPRENNSKSQPYKLALSHLQLEGARTGILQVQIYHAPRVHLDVSTPDASEDNTPPPHLEAAARGRLTRAFRIDAASAPPAEITVSTNPLTQKEAIQVEEVQSEKSRTGEHAVSLPRSAEVLLADIRLAWNEDGACQGVAEFDLDPAGSATCPLRMPAEFRLLSAAVDGVAVLPRTTSAGGWQLPLFSEQLPQRITVIFTGRISEPAEPGVHTFSAPALGNLPVQQTFWTLAGPALLRPYPPERTPPQTEAQLALLRLQSLTAVQRTAIQRLSGDAEQRLRWCPQARRRWTNSADAVRRAILPQKDTPEGKTMQKTLAALEEEHRDLARRLGLEELQNQILTETLPVNDAAKRWDTIFSHRDSLIRLSWERSPFSPSKNQAAPLAAASGENGTVAPGMLTLEFSRAPRPASHARLTATGIFLVGVLLAAWGIRRRLWTQLIHERPYAVATACGLAWWCWLRPSFFGLLIILLTLLAKFRAWYHSSPLPGNK